MVINIILNLFRDCMHIFFLLYSSIIASDTLTIVLITFCDLFQCSKPRLFSYYNKIINIDSFKNLKKKKNLALISIILGVVFVSNSIIVVFVN